MKPKHSATKLRNCSLLLVSISVFLVAAPSRSQEPKLTAATVEIEKRIRDSGAEVSVAFRTLDGKAEWYFHADDSVHAASTMKVPVMIELFHQVREGKVKLD